MSIAVLCLKQSMRVILPPLPFTSVGIELNHFVYIALTKKPLKFKQGEIKTDQKGFAK